MERSAWLVTRVISRISDPNYYRTYREAKHEPPGLRSVQAEVTAALARPSDFIEVTGGVWHWLAKSSGLFRDTSSRKWPAHVVQDGNYLSARWPGDVHTFALRFAKRCTAGRESSRPAPRISRSKNNGVGRTSTTPVGVAVLVLGDLMIAPARQASVSCRSCFLTAVVCKSSSKKALVRERA
jgi:hypothetical protein